MGFGVAAAGGDRIRRILVLTSSRVLRADLYRSLANEPRSGSGCRFRFGRRSIAGLLSRRCRYAKGNWRASRRIDFGKGHPPWEFAFSIGGSIADDPRQARGIYVFARSASGSPVGLSRSREPRDRKAVTEAQE